MSLDEMAPPETEAPAVLRVDELAVEFRGVKALQDVSFSIPRGGISSVIGPNGAGKTTLFNCISGVAKHQGTVELDGRDLSRLRADRRATLGIARTFQTPLLIASSRRWRTCSWVRTPASAAASWD